MEEKRIYSLNLATYISLSTGLLPEIKRDQDANGFLYYCVYPERAEVAKAIADFRKPEVEVDLHRFLNCYRIIKDMIKLMKG